MLFTRPWGEGDSLFTVGLCLITEDFWSTSARGARAPGRTTTIIMFLIHHKIITHINYKLLARYTEEHWIRLTQRHLLTRNCIPGGAFKSDFYKIQHQIGKKAVYITLWRGQTLKVIYCWTHKLLALLESIITTGEVKDKSNRDMVQTLFFSCSLHTNTHRSPNGALGGGITH